MHSHPISFFFYYWILLNFFFFFLMYNVNRIRRHHCRQSPGKAVQQRKKIKKTALEKKIHLPHPIKSLLPPLLPPLLHHTLYIHSTLIYNIWLLTSAMHTRLGDIENTTGSRWEAHCQNMWDRKETIQKQTPKKKEGGGGEGYSFIYVSTGQ